MVCELLQPAGAAKPSGFFHKALKWGNVASDNLFAKGTREGRGIFMSQSKSTRYVPEDALARAPSRDGMQSLPSALAARERGHLPKSPATAHQPSPLEAWKLMLCTHLLEKWEKQTNMELLGSQGLPLGLCLPSGSDKLACYQR